MFSLRVAPYLILSAPTLHAAAVCWEGGRELEGIVNYMLERGWGTFAFPAFLQNMIKWTCEWHASCWREN